GRIRVEPILIKKSSWLGRNHSYLQFGLFYLGLCSRILFVNSSRWALATFLLFTIGAAILIGFLYGGKTWCNYFCPMAPVQKIYGEPRGLFNSTAHQGSRRITQSMCRTITPAGKEQSACVGCQTPCIDIDSERTYWDGVTKPDRQLIYYGYLGLVIGYFCYYYLYAGNWDYYMSGIWTHEHNQLGKLLSPGFYLFESAIPIPKLVAVPMTLAFFGGGSYFLGRFLEKQYKAHLQYHRRHIQHALLRHRMFTLCTFIVFNFFFVFGGRYFVGLLPIFFQYCFEALIVLVSTLWFYRTWKRNPERYLRESLANSLRNQLSMLRLDVSRFVEGRSLEDLDPNEIYILAKILPGFTQEKRLQTYRGVLLEALEGGYISSSSSLEVLLKMRLELDISDQDHERILAEVGIENPELFSSFVSQPLFL
nr:4Fe-4S binding protein [Leptolyngbyaceae cyanobacterium MO_188.B28]